MNKVFQLTALTISILLPVQAFGMAAFASKWATQATERYNRDIPAKIAESTQKAYHAVKPTEEQKNATQAFQFAQAQFNKAQDHYNETIDKETAPAMLGGFTSYVVMTSSMGGIVPGLIVPTALLTWTANSVYRIYSARNEVAQSKSNLHDAAMKYAIVGTRA